jgi:hypothetical protein
VKIIWQHSVEETISSDTLWLPIRTFCRMHLRASFTEMTSFYMRLNVISGMWGIDVGKIVTSAIGKQVAFYFALITDALLVLNGLSCFARLTTLDIPKFDVSIGFLVTASIFQASAKSIYFALRRKKFQRYVFCWQISVALNNYSHWNLALTVMTTLCKTPLYPVLCSLEFSHNKVNLRFRYTTPQLQRITLSLSKLNIWISHRISWKLKFLNAARRAITAPPPVNIFSITQ